jgi:hypothetical protein
MADRAAQRLAGKLPQDLADFVKKFPMRYLRLAQIAEKAGNDDAAFDNYARYLLVCREMGLKSMPMEAEYNTMIMKRMGYSPLNDTYDLAKMLGREEPSPETP